MKNVDREITTLLAAALPKLVLPFCLGCALAHPWVGRDGEWGGQSKTEGIVDTFLVLVESEDLCVTS